MRVLHAAGQSDQLRKEEAGSMNGLIWKRVEARRKSGEEDFTMFAPLYRAKVPGGWLILYEDPKKGGVCFYPDPEHEWDGSSLPD